MSKYIIRLCSEDEISIEYELTDEQFALLQDIEEKLTQVDGYPFIECGSFHVSSKSPPSFKVLCIDCSDENNDMFIVGNTYKVILGTLMISKSKPFSLIDSFATVESLNVHLPNFKFELMGEYYE